VLGPKFMKYLKQLSSLTGLGEQEVVKRALAMYSKIKVMELEGFKPCMLKDRMARLLQEK
jgi:hypothetical protein